ncbi:hypothetical protein LPB90_18155 [Chryseobacterium sp. LC2016-29]|uniref:hypothetical protein n=1 Tax=Chryseobacterium sp. LC2016-29 TaxID=2897331 RepID=UPI001E35FBA5|nr:hypothetical protein [Chryseobacterium sp. LC2016-29]MCD0480365.1 hypothetical protein [Chryseobacterium sp. LC2016-29]
MENIDFNMKKELITIISDDYKNKQEPMWNFRSKNGEIVLDFCLENYTNKNVLPELEEYFSNAAQGQNTKRHSLKNLESLEKLNMSKSEIHALKVLIVDLWSKYESLVEKIFESRNKETTIADDIAGLFRKGRNFTEDEFSVVFDHILINHYHRQDYSGARDLVFNMSEEDRAKFNKKFTAGHSEDLLKRHFTDFENLNQEEFKEAVFKVTGKVENIPVPPVLYENNIYQFTNHSFKDKFTGDTLYLLNDVNNNQYFLEHSFVKDPNQEFRANTVVDLLDSKDFNTSEFSAKYTLQLINSVLDVTNVLQDLYNPSFDNSKVQEQLKTKTLQEKKDIGDITLKIVLQSHLSDAIIELQTKNPDLVESRLDFCKHLIHKYGDLDMGIKEVDLNNLWTKVWNSKQKIEKELEPQITSDKKTGILTVELAEENFRKGDWAVNEILDKNGNLILLLQEMGHKHDNYLIQYPATKLYVNYKTIEQAVERFNEIVVENNLTNEIISFNNQYTQDEELIQSYKEHDRNTEKINREIESFLDSVIQPKGDVESYPKEVLHKMLLIQHKQKGHYDLESIEKDKFSSFNPGGTVQGKEFWEDVISNNNFERFFERYPEEKFDNNHLQNKDFRI